MDVHRRSTLSYWGSEDEQQEGRQPTQRIDLQVGEEQVLVQVEEPDDEVGQDPADRRHTQHMKHASGCSSIDCTWHG